MRDAYILAAVRTPIGKIRGALKDIRPDDLAALALAGLATRARFDPAQIDEVVLGCANQAGEDNRNVARMALLLAGLPDEVPAVTVNRLCGSGLEAVVQAARAIATGDAELVDGRRRREHDARAVGDGEDRARRFAAGRTKVFDTTPRLALPEPAHGGALPARADGRDGGERRRALRRLARGRRTPSRSQSHRRAVAAQKAGCFDDEIVAVERAAEEGAGRSASTADEWPRADTTLEKLAKLKPAFRKGGTVTAGNSSPLNDGAAAVLLGTAEQAAGARARAAGARRRVGAAPASTRASWAWGRCRPGRKALARAGLDGRRPGSGRAERGVRGAVARLHARAGARPGAGQRERRRHRARPPPRRRAARASWRRSSTRCGAARRKRGLATMCIGVGQGIAALIER